VEDTRLNQTNIEFDEKTLLVISSQFPDSKNQFLGGIFVKQQIEPIKSKFKRIIVIAPVLRAFFLKENSYCQDYSYDNVDVFFPRCLYIPRPIHRIISKYTDLVFDNRARVVENLLEREKIHFDLIHAHFTWPSGYIAMRLKNKYRVPFALTIHEDPVWFNEDIKRGHPLWKDIWTRADAIIRVSKMDLTRLQVYNHSTYSLKCGVSSQFIPLDKLESRKKLNIPNDKKVIFSLGFLSERKGFNFLIDSVTILTKERKDIICLIGGSDPSGLGQIEKKLKKQIQQNGLEDVVHLLGLIPENQLVETMNSCDIFVLPSLSESFGIVILEAMACGKPVISTDNGGSNEIVTSDEFGFLVQPADSEKLAEKILEALDKKWDPVSIRRHAEEFSWDAIGDQIIEIYRKILNVNG
jgi:teichuronic acid biosynthesis glycosyltransferase TuaC